MPAKVADKLLAWGWDNIEPATIMQAAKTARLPFVQGHVALMPDAHVGIGSTVGSVIPTSGAIMPAAVGVDIGCGMIASQTMLEGKDLPDNLDHLMSLIEQRIPAGLNKSHDWGKQPVNVVKITGLPKNKLGDNSKEQQTIISQFGTLGSGNHFVEVCLDERGIVWTVLHSGSRGIGNKLARIHIETAKKLMKQWFITLEDPDLAYFVQGEPQFTAYIEDMLWAQQYAYESRVQMNHAVVTSLFEVCGKTTPIQVINCHHNFTVQENYHGKDLWITRKGAVRARADDWVIVPGSMATGTYIGRGLGNDASYNSSAHGAGRRMSRGKAKEMITAERLTADMQGITWNADKALSLRDEAPGAYKDLGDVMEAQQDLVQVEHVLHPVLNYKGC
jgi:tRNA-splicing ligase RtcB